MLLTTQWAGVVLLCLVPVHSVALAGYCFKVGLNTVMLGVQNQRVFSGPVTRPIADPLREGIGLVRKKLPNTSDRFFTNTGGDILSIARMDDQ